MVKAPSSYPSAIPIQRELPPRDAEWLARITYATPRFPGWPSDAPKPADTKGGKPLVTSQGQATFGELAILQAFEADGWEGRWIDNFPMPPTFRRHYWGDDGTKLSRLQANLDLPAAPKRVYDKICANSQTAGAWDLILWRDEEMAFIEAKRAGSSDRIRAPQLLWMNAALNLKIPPQSLIFAEWRIAGIGAV